MNAGMIKRGNMHPPSRPMSKMVIEPALPICFSLPPRLAMASPSATAHSATTSASTRSARGLPATCMPNSST